MGCACSENRTNRNKERIKNFTTNDENEVEQMSKILNSSNKEKIAKTKLEDNKNEQTAGETEQKINEKKEDNKDDNEVIKSINKSKENENSINNNISQDNNDNNNDNNNQSLNNNKRDNINNSLNKNSINKNSIHNNSKENINKISKNSIHNSQDNINNNSKDNNINKLNQEKEEENLPFPQSILKNSSQKEKTKVYTNEGNEQSKINRPNNNEENIVNDNNNNKLNNNHYEQFESNNELYLICPECHQNILKIESVLYQIDSKEFLVTYICLCREPTQNFFYNIISKNKANCENHKEEIIKFCEDCKELLCKNCPDEHKEHKIKNIINKDIISEEIMDKIKEKKDEFKGINVLQNIFDFYQSEKNINPDLFNYQELKFKEVNNSLKYANAYKGGTVVSKSQEKMNYINTKTIQAHNDRISSLIKLQNNMIATGSYDSKVKIWDISKNENDALILVKNAIGTVFCLLEFEPGKLLGGTSANMINLWDLNDKNNKEYIHNFYQHYLWVHALVKCDEDHFASASNDTKIIIWNYRTIKSEKILEGHTDCIMDMIMLQNGHLCTASADETIRIWDWKEAKCLYFFKPHKKYVKCICELNNKLLITGSEDNTIGIWKENSPTYENIKFLEGHKYPVRSLCQLDDKHFVSGSFDNKIKIWNLNKLEDEQTLEGHKSNVISVIKYKDDVIISCSNDKTIKVWENSKI